jgi:thioredoxin-related protein
MPNVPKVANYLVAALVIVALISGCATSPNPALESAAGVAWLSGYDAGLKSARAADKPLLLYFHATWCAFCKKMDTEVFPASEVSELIAKHFVLVKVDIDQRENAMSLAKYMVRGTPTFVIVNRDEEVLVGNGGRPSGYFIGAMDKQEFLEFLNAFVER